MNVIQSLKHFLMLTIVVLLLNGCSATPSEWFFTSASENSEDLSMSDNRDSINLENSQKLIEEARDTATEKKLDALLAEWQAVKSDINRVIELESELGFIINELTKQDSLNSLQEPSIQLAEYTPQSMPETGQGEFIESDADFAVAAQQLSQNPIVGSAMPLMDDSNVMDSKFSSQVNSLDITNKQIMANNISTNKPLSDDKFSNSDNGQPFSLAVNKTSIVGSLPSANPYENSPDLKMATIDNQKCELSSQNNQIGIHLISLKDEGKVSKAANDLLKKFSAELCTTIKVNNVVVKGENYFSVRFGPYLSKQEAQDACTSIRSQGQYCGLTEFVGQLM